MKHPYSQMPLPFYEGGDPHAGTPMSLLMEGATGCDQSVDDWCPLLLLAGVPIIVRMSP